MILACLLMLSLGGGPVYGVDSAQVDGYLKGLHTSNSTFSDRLVSVVRDGAGATYADGPLGEGPTGGYDSDPLIDLSKVDCVTFVEQSIALAQGRDLAETTALLQQIRYAGGRVDYATRNHFMLVDWVAHNPWCKETTTTLGVKSNELTRRISMRDFFKLVKAPELGQDIEDRDVTINYLPVEAIDEVELALRTPTLVVFVGKVKWLFALHCGVYLPSADGAGAMYHASSKAGLVVATDLSDYVRSQGDRYIGVATYEMTDPAGLETTDSRP